MWQQLRLLVFGGAQIILKSYPGMGLVVRLSVHLTNVLQLIIAWVELKSNALLRQRKHQSHTEFISGDEAQSCIGPYPIFLKRNPKQCTIKLLCDVFGNNSKMHTVGVFLDRVQLYVPFRTQQNREFRSKFRTSFSSVFSTRDLVHNK